MASFEGASTVTDDEGPMSRATDRLARAIDLLEAAVIERSSRVAASGSADLAALTDALRTAEMERTVLSDASRAAAAQLDKTIGRLRGLLTP